MSIRSTLHSIVTGALLSALAPLTAAAAAPPGCDIHWRLAPQWNEAAPRLRVELSFDADARSRSELVLPGPVDPASLQAGDSTQIVDATRPLPAGLGVSLAQRSGERAVLRYELRAAGDGPSYRLGTQHLYFAGRALLALPAALAERPSLQMCLQVDGLSPAHLLASSLHASTGDDGLLRWQGSPALAREIVVAAGALQRQERQAEGQQLQVLLPADADVPASALADAVEKTVAAQRRFWGVGEAGRMLVMLQPEDRGALSAAAALHGALLLRAQRTLLTPDPAFEMLLGHGWLRGWFRERFGPTAYASRPDDPAGAWFVEGFSLFYALRLHAAQADGSVDGLARGLTLLAQQPAAERGALPWLAAHWHSALQARGRPGLDAVLQRLIVPAPQAWPTGPTSQPLAMHRLQAALRPQLGETISADVQRYGFGASPPDAATLGPCFRMHEAERRIEPAAAAPSPACRAWLGIGRSAAQADAAKPAAKAGTRGSTKLAGAKKGGAKPEAAKRPVKRARR